MFDLNEPFDPSQMERECAAREAEQRENAQIAELQRTVPTLKAMLPFDSVLVWERTSVDRLCLVIVTPDKPDIDVNYEDGQYVAQAYDHLSILHDFVDPNPAVIAAQIKVWLSEHQGGWLSAAEADRQSGR